MKNCCAFVSLQRNLPDERSVLHWDFVCTYGKGVEHEEFPFFYLREGIPQGIKIKSFTSAT